MAKFSTYNPAVEEALSAPIASMSNAISLMSDVLSLGTTSLTDEVMSELFIDDDDRYRIYVVDLNKRGWLETPAPVIKMNGTVITPTTNGFEINYLGGCINFLSESSRPTSTDIITASFTYVNGTSSTISGINTSISTLNAKTANYRGSFDTLAQLKSGVVNPLQYDYAYVFGTVSDIYFYNSSISDWLSVTANDVADLEAQITALQNGKENSIGTKNTAFNKNFGTGNEEVMRGDYAYSKSDTDTAIATKEPIISDKGTAFNKDFGTVANTVAQGNYVAPSFTATTDFENILSGETTITLFGKIKRWFTEIGKKFDKENILSYNELSAVTEEGKYVADAMAVSKIDNDLGKINVYVNETDGKLHFVDKVGADSVLNFSTASYFTIQGQGTVKYLEREPKIITAFSSNTSGDWFAAYANVNGKIEKSGTGVSMTVSGKKVTFSGGGTQVLTHVFWC